MLKFKVHSDESYEHVPVLDEIPIHIYKNLIKEYIIEVKVCKRPSTRKRKPKKYLD